MKLTQSICLMFLAAATACQSVVAAPSTLTFYGPFSDDASTGISTSKTYTHAISGGTAATINGVSMAALTPSSTPADFTWSTNGLNKNSIVCCNNGDWQPAAGGVTGAELTTLLGSFTYSSNGDTAPSSQRFTLSGLTPGNNYETQLYVRVWDTEASGRPIDLTFTNGAEVNILPSDFYLQDRPAAIGMPSEHSAYSIAYQFTAEGTELSIDTAVAAAGGAASGSFHMYALTNELLAVPEPAGGLMLASSVLGWWATRRRKSA